MDCNRHVDFVYHSNHHYLSTSPIENDMKKEFTENDTLGVMHEYVAWAFRKIADHSEQQGLTREEILKLLRDMADENEAQSMVVNLRDTL